jgi:polyhydroxyalkanoate synthesis regulator phasin
MRWLAARGELREDELRALADDVAEKARWTKEAQEKARRRLDAALEGLAARDEQDNDALTTQKEK